MLASQILEEDSGPRNNPSVHVEEHKGDLTGLVGLCVPHSVVSKNAPCVHERVANLVNELTSDVKVHRDAKCKWK